MGSSDSTGNKQVNETLSFSRATKTSMELNNLGLDIKQMYVTGLGQLEIQDVNSTSRKVMFNVIYVKKTDVQ
jgi:outer membrane protein OmpA-like peptidoglycan-associated protein